MFDTDPLVWESANSALLITWMLARVPMQWPAHEHWPVLEAPAREPELLDAGFGAWFKEELHFPWAQTYGSAQSLYVWHGSPSMGVSNFYTFQKTRRSSPAYLCSDQPTSIALHLKSLKKTLSCSDRYSKRNCNSCFCWLGMWGRCRIGCLRKRGLLIAL
jgi:hypothetical protein